MLQMQAPYDMQKAWDARIRKFYGSRYDYKRNAVHTLLHQCCHLQHVHRAVKLLLVSPSKWQSGPAFELFVLYWSAPCIHFTQRAM